MTDTIREAVERYLEARKNHLGTTSDQERIHAVGLPGGEIALLTTTDLRALLTRAEAAEAERDAIQAKLALAVEALKECQGELDQYSQNEYPSDHPLHVRYRKRDHDSNPARIALAQLTDTPKEES